MQILEYLQTWQVNIYKIQAHQLHWILPWNLNRTGSQLPTFAFDYVKLILYLLSKKWRNQRKFIKKIFNLQTLFDIQFQGSTFFCIFLYNAVSHKLDLCILHIGKCVKSSVFNCFSQRIKVNLNALNWPHCL